MQNIYVLFYIPNLIGYLRLCLVIFAWYYFDQPRTFLTLYTIQALLDAVDGWTARYFNQISKFGTWFDIFIDNFGRGILWTRISSIGIFVNSIEWLTFLALNHQSTNWKTKLSLSNDIIVRSVMKDGFRAPVGFLAIVIGIHCLPIVIYIIKYQVLCDWLIFLLHNLKTICIIGRLISLYCEIYVIRMFVIEDLLNE